LVIGLSTPTHRFLALYPTGIWTLFSGFLGNARIVVEVKLTSL